jgi:hypothetical protein
MSWVFTKYASGGPHGATPTTHIFKLPLGLVGNRKCLIVLGIGVMAAVSRTRTKDPS